MTPEVHFATYCKPMIDDLNRKRESDHELIFEMHGVLTNGLTGTVSALTAEVKELKKIRKPTVWDYVAKWSARIMGIGAMISLLLLIFGVINT